MRRGYWCRSAAAPVTLSTGIKPAARRSANFAVGRTASDLASGFGCVARGNANDTMANFDLDVRENREAIMDMKPR
jgi:hypothetical protein